MSLNFVNTTAATTLGGEGSTIITIETIKITGGSGDHAFTAHDGADTLDGGDGNDVLAGNGGADIIKGGTGTDTASFRGAHGTYSLQRVDGASRSWIVTDMDAVANGNDGADTLTGVETLSFAAGAPATVCAEIVFT